MAFVKYSVIELGVEENIPGWARRVKVGNLSDDKSDAAAVSADAVEPVANKTVEDEDEISMEKGLLNGN